MCATRTPPHDRLLSAALDGAVTPRPQNGWYATHLRHRTRFLAPVPVRQLLQPTGHSDRLHPTNEEDAGRGTKMDPRRPQRLPTLGVSRHVGPAMHVRRAVAT